MISSSVSKYWTWFRNIGNPCFREFVGTSMDHTPLADESARPARNRKAMEMAIGWMRTIQERQPDGGIAGFVWFDRGRMKVSGSYPETTGYSIPTLFEHASLFGKEEARAAAVRAAEFLLPLQEEDGSFPGGLVGELTGPSVFNTAQMVDGLIVTYAETNDKRYLDSARRACDWICRVQEEDGTWGKFNYLGEKRVYDTKVSEILLKASTVVPGQDWSKAAHKNLEWAVSKQLDNGWFQDCDNSSAMRHMPLTHTIGYTVQGLLESYKVTKRERYLSAAERTLGALRDLFGSGDRLLAARYLSDWRPAARYSCITGDAQISICWTTLYFINGDDRYLQAARRMNDLLNSIQVHCEVPELNGSVPSSWPVNGDYFPYRINNWAVKYYVDALRLDNLASLSRMA